MAETTINPAAPIPATVPATTPTTAKPSDWSPLRNPVFRALWIASAISYTGYEIRNYAAPGLMVDLKKFFAVSDGMAAYTFTASTLPIPFLVLFAGALADIVDRRKLLIATHIWMMIAAGLLGVLTMAHLMTPWLMLAFLFAIGAGYAMMNPALLAVIPELVGPSELRSAMALNSVNMNIARVLGPAIGALIVGIFALAHFSFYAGKGMAFLATALSLTGVVWVLIRWKPDERKAVAQPESVWQAVNTGFRYTRFSPKLLAILARVFLFIFFAGILNTFSVIICKKNPGTLHGDTGAGIWMVCLGIGAIIGVYFMQALQRRFGIEETVTVCILAYGAAMLGVATSPTLWLGCLAMFIAGFNWVIVPTNFNIATQLAVPAWVKGRAMGMYVLVLWGSMAAGSAVFGRVATAYGPRNSLFYAGIGVLVGSLAIFWLRLEPKTKEDYAPAKRPAPAPSNLDELQGAHVRVAMEYHVPVSNRERFETLMHDLRRRRLQNGAARWSLDNGVAQNGRYVFREIMHFRSWPDRLRHHERTTQADLAIEQQVQALHAGDGPPTAIHEPYTPIAGVEGHPRPSGQVIADWADMVIGKMQREFVVLIERTERLRERERRT